MKIHLKISSANWRPCCPGADELKILLRFSTEHSSYTTILCAKFHKDVATEMKVMKFLINLLYCCGTVSNSPPLTPSIRAPECHPLRQYSKLLDDSGQNLIMECKCSWSCAAAGTVSSGLQGNGWPWWHKVLWEDKTHNIKENDRLPTSWYQSTTH